jgi:hypothetical protein
MYHIIGTLIALTILSAPVLVNTDPPPKAKPSAPRKDTAVSPRKTPAPQPTQKLRFEQGKLKDLLLLTEPQLPDNQFNTTREPRRTRHLLLTPEDEQRVRVSHPLVTPDTKSETKHIPVRPEIRIPEKKPPTEKKN